MPLFSKKKSGSKLQPKAGTPGGSPAAAAPVASPQAGMQAGIDSDSSGDEDYSDKEKAFLGLMGGGGTVRSQRKGTDYTLPSQRLGVAQPAKLGGAPDSPAPAPAVPAYDAPSPQDFAGEEAPGGADEEYGDEEYGEEEEEGEETAAPSLNPEGEWKSAKSPNGRTYYYHTVTNATRWDMPPEMAAAQSAGGDDDSSSPGSAQMKQELKDAQEEIEQLKIKISDVEGLREKDRAQVATLRTEADTLRSSNQSLEEQLQMRDQSSGSEVETARADAAKAREEVAAAHRDHEELKGKLAEAVARLTSAASEHAAQLATKDEEIQNMRAHAAQIHQAAGASAGLQAELGQLQAQLAEVKENEAMQKTWLEGKDNELQMLREAAGKANQRAMAAEQQLAGAQQAQAKAEGDARTSMAQLEAEKLAKQRLSEQHQQLAGQAQAASGMQVELQTLKQKLQQAEQANQAQQKEWGMLEQAMRQNLEQAQQAAQQAAQERNNAQVKVQQLEQQLQAGGGGAAAGGAPPAVAPRTTAQPVQPKMGMPVASRSPGVPAARGVMPGQPQQFQNRPAGSQYATSPGGQPKFAQPPPASARPTGAPPAFRPGMGAPAVPGRPMGTPAPPPPAKMSPQDAFNLMPYFHGKLGGGQAEALLRNRPVASFLIRFSSQAGKLAVSYVWHGGQIVHALIGYDDDKVWQVDDPTAQYPDLAALVAATQHVMAYPVGRQF